MLVKILVLLVIAIVVIGLVRKAIAGTPRSDAARRDDPRIPSPDQADTPSSPPTDPHA